MHWTSARGEGGLDFQTRCRRNFIDFSETTACTASLNDGVFTSRAAFRTRAARFNGPQPEVPAERINYRPAGESSDKLPVLTRGRIELSLPNTLDWRERGELSLFRCA